MFREFLVQHVFVVVGELTSFVRSATTVGCDSAAAIAWLCGGVQVVVHPELFTDFAFATFSRESSDLLTGLSQA